MADRVRAFSAIAAGLAAAIPAAPLLAQDGAITITGNAAIVSESRFRGVDLSGGDPAIQAGIDLAHASGVYAGAWGSSLDDDTTGLGHSELDLYAGWSGPVAEGITATVGAIYYLYPDAGPGDFDYVEAYGSLRATLGPADATLGVAYAPEQDSLGGGDNLYLYAELGAGLPGTPISLAARLGYTDGFLTYTADGNAFDWSLGATYAVTGNLSLGASYVGAQGSGTPAYDFVDDTVVGKVTLAF